MQGQHCKVVVFASGNKLYMDEFENVPTAICDISWQFITRSDCAHMTLLTCCRPLCVSLISPLTVMEKSEVIQLNQIVRTY